MNSNGLVKMGSRSIVYVGIYALIYLHTILGERIVSRDGLPRGVLPSGILKMRKKCPGLKVPCSSVIIVLNLWFNLMALYKPIDFKLVYLYFNSIKLN